MPIVIEFAYLLALNDSTNNLCHYALPANDFTIHIHGILSSIFSSCWINSSLGIGINFGTKICQKIL